MSRERVVISWSGGKDSALALRAILQSPEYEVAVLLTTCTEGFRRISMHGVRCSLLKAQAEQIGLPLRKVFIAPDCGNEKYESAMIGALSEFKRNGIERVVFGDLFLEDIRKYREAMLGRIGMAGIYPLWGRNTRELAREFIADGFRAALVCVDPRAIDAKFAGRLFDESLLADLPAGADPCGENGEFHTFVFDGPIFRSPVRHRRGPVIARNNFYFAELLPLHAKGGATSKKKEQP